MLRYVLDANEFTLYFANNPQTLKYTRQLLDQSHYTQIPQLSCGLDIDLDEMTLVL